MVVTMKQLSEDEKIRMQCEAREDYERCLITEYNAGKQDGIEQGIQLGRSEGEISKERELITKWLQKGKSIAEIAENLDRTEEYVKKFM